jgi:N-acetylglucosamine kinase-like BadF-type ATPase
LPLPLAHKLYFSNDAELILGALLGRVGLGLICGTGSIAVGCDSTGKKARAGGWGHYFGDEGSGLWLGREALRASSKMADGRGPKTLLLDYILKEWGLTQAEGIISQVYTEPRPDNARIARLSHLVFLAADDGDVVSLNLVNRAAAELAQIVRAVYQKLSFTQPPTLAIAGGIIINSPRLVGQLERVLKHHIPIAGFVPVPEPALAAARAFVG